jgi:arylsulfatase A
LIDFTDVLPTFADLAGAPLPAGPALDGRSFAPQIRGERGTPREWVYVQHNTAHQWYALEHGWKLTHAGDLFDMSDAPFAEKLVSPGEANDAADAARVRLQAVLDQLNPRAGKLAPVKEPGVVSKKEKKKKKKEKAAAAQ